MKPGRYPYLSNYDFSQYLDLAGGQTKNATRKKFVIKAGTGQRLPYNNKIIIKKGDILFIPDKPEMDSWELFKDILSTLGTVGTLIILIQNVGVN